MQLTPLVFPEFHRLVHLQLISICLGIEAVKGLESDRKISGADIDGAPRRNSLELVDLGLDIFEMTLSKAPYR